MKIQFYKYQGAGNDFIIIDNRDSSFRKNDNELIKNLCDRRFGIGADGLILLESSKTADFKMVYFNADGNEGSMCGNGGRCIVAFAKKLNIIDFQTTFDAIDGLHFASINNGNVNLKMVDVNEIEMKDNYLFLNTGSPHHICWSDDVDALNIKKVGAKIRYSEPYSTEGTNVNFAEQTSKNSFKVRTYERGVENETLACGTGVTAVAIASNRINKTSVSLIKIKTLGGNLEVSFKKDGDLYREIFLNGPAEFVFEGKIEI